MDLDSGESIVDSRISVGNQMVNSVDFTAFDNCIKREQSNRFVQRDGVFAVQGYQISRRGSCDKAPGYPLWIRALDCG